MLGGQGMVTAIDEVQWDMVCPRDEGRLETVVGAKGDRARG